MRVHQLALPASERYQKKAADLFTRIKALKHPDIKRYKGALAEVACLHASVENGPRYVELYKQYELQQPPRNSTKVIGHTGVLKIDIRCWREVSLTAAKIAIADDFDFKTRELVCLALIELEDLTDRQLTKLLLALPVQKAALLKKPV